MRFWIRLIATFVATMSITLDWPEWLALVLVVATCLVWGITGYLDGLEDGSDLK